MAFHQGTAGAPAGAAAGAGWRDAVSRDDPLPRGNGARRNGCRGLRRGEAVSSQPLGCRKAMFDHLPNVMDPCCTLNVAIATPIPRFVGVQPTCCCFMPWFEVNRQLRQRERANLLRRPSEGQTQLAVQAAPGAVAAPC